MFQLNSKNQLFTCFLFWIIICGLKGKQKVTGKLKNNEKLDIPKSDLHHKDIDLKMILRQKERRAAISDHDRLWEEGVIPYEMHPECSKSIQRTVRSAMDEWESKTCLKFIEVEAIHLEKLIIRSKGKCGCCSEIGRRYKLKQYLTLDENQCNYKEAALHELGHTIGFDHEHKRPDRDKYVKILYENIEKKFQNQFSKLSDDEVNSLDSPYDFDSIMHYSSDVYAISIQNETMQPLNSSLSLKDLKTTLSVTDVAQTNKLYKCPNCLFNLYGEKGTISSSNIASLLEDNYCQWYIRRNRGEFIEFFIEYVDIPVSKNCSMDYLEIRDGYWSKSPLIGKFCGNYTLQKHYKTSSHRLLITYKSNNITKYGGFFLNYTTVCSGMIKGQRGLVESVHLRDSYSVNSQCNWTIAVPMPFKVAVHFESFNFEYDENCTFSMEVRDGSGNESEILGIFCGHEQSRNMLSSNNTVSIIFSTNDWNATDFSFSFFTEINECELPDKGGCNDICNNTIGSYHCDCQEGKLMFPDKKRCENIVDNCGGIINITERTVIASPFFPNEYPVNISCTWKIVNEDVRITFLYMDVQGSKKECQDEVFLSGYNITNRSYCGWRTPQPIILTSVPDITIRFIAGERLKNWKKWIGFSTSIEPM